MRATMPQLYMMDLLGELTMGPDYTLRERIKSGHEGLVKETGEDFGYDARKWHEYLLLIDDYCWRKWHLEVPELIKRAESNSEWRNAIRDLMKDDGHA